MMMLRKFLVLNCSITGPVVISSPTNSRTTCPKCGSTDITSKSSNDDIATKQCNKCKAIFNLPTEKKYAVFR